MALNILLADDHEVVRLGVRALIERQPGMKVVADASTVQEAIAQTEALAPDVVVLDIRMPGGTGLDACREQDAWVVRPATGGTGLADGGSAGTSVEPETETLTSENKPVANRRLTASSTSAAE